jgi:hypothetical protein
MNQLAGRRILSTGPLIQQSGKSASSNKWSRTSPSEKSARPIQRVWPSGLFPTRESTCAGLR